MSDDFEPSELPKPGDTLFKGTGSIRDAFLDWWDDRERALVDSYKRAADHLTLLAIKENYHPEDHFFPASFLYRHWLELCLKRLVKDACAALKVNPDGKLNHDLESLWNRLEGLLPKVWPELEPVVTAAARGVIMEFHAVDSRGTEFRYATHKDGKPTLDKAPKRVDMVNLYEVMDRLEFFLGCCGEGIWMLTHEHNEGVY